MVELQDGDQIYYDMVKRFMNLVSKDSIVITVLEGGQEDENTFLGIYKGALVKVFVSGGSFSVKTDERLRIGYPEFGMIGVGTKEELCLKITCSNNNLHVE